MKPKFAIVVTGILTFFLLVTFNYFRAQRDISETRSSPLSATLVSYPEKIKVGSIGTFIWNIEATSDLTAASTALYWGYESSASALTKLDSPSAVGYPNTQSDYSVGQYRLPSTFDVNIRFPKAGKVYFRSYAKVRDWHVWSEEMTLEVQK